MLAIQSVSMGLAETDFAHHRDFAAAAESYRRMLVKKMNDDMTYNAGKQDFSYLAQPALWRTVEDFRYDAPSTGWALRNQTISPAILIQTVVDEVEKDLVESVAIDGDRRQTGGEIGRDRDRVLFFYRSFAEKRGRASFDTSSLHLYS